MMKRISYLVGVALSVLLFVVPASAADKPSDTEAVVTLVEGSARVYARGEAAGRPLKKGDRIGKDREVRVGDRSRVELRFPDGTVMRLWERSRLAMDEVQFDKKTETKKLRVDLGLGRLWAKVKALVTPDSSVEVKTGNAVAGVRGTVYRVNVDEDRSAMVKVYDGTVYVAGTPKEGTGKPPAQVSAPVPVPGPHEVPPPYHEVTMEEWTAIVKAMQQLTISPQGVPSKPEDFDPKADADDWVRWNQARDREMQF